MREAQSWRDTARRGVTRYNLFRDSDLPSSWRDTAGRGGGGRIGFLAAGEALPGGGVTRYNLVWRYTQQLERHCWGGGYGGGRGGPYI